MGGFRVIRPEDYLGAQGPSVGTALSNALMRAFQMRQFQMQDDERKARIALEARRVAAQEEATRRAQDAENRRAAHEERGYAQANLDKEQASLVESLKGLVSQSAEPILAAGQAPIAAPGGGPPGTAEVAQRLSGVVGPNVAPSLAGSLEHMIPQNLKAILDPGYMGSQNPETGGLSAIPALIPQLLPQLRAGASPILPSVRLPRMVDQETGAQVPPKVVPVQFREDVLAEEERKRREALAQKRSELELGEEFKPETQNTPEGTTTRRWDSKKQQFVDAYTQPKTAAPKPAADTDFDGIVRESPLTGKPYVSSEDVAPTERKDLSIYARQNKIKYMDKDDAVGIQELGRAKADLDAAWRSMEAAFPKNLVGVGLNKVLSAVQWGDNGAALKAYNKTKADFGVRVFRATAGSAGLRVQQGILDKVLASLPDPTTDTLATGRDAFKRINVYMQNVEDGAFPIGMEGREKKRQEAEKPLGLAGPPIIMQEP